MMSENPYNPQHEKPVLEHHGEKTNPSYSAKHLKPLKHQGEPLPHSQSGSPKHYSQQDARNQPSSKKTSSHKTRKVVLTIIIIVAAVAAICGFIWYNNHSGNGTDTVGVGTTTINAESENLSSKDINALIPFSTLNATTNVGNGTVTNIITVEDDSHLILETQMNNMQVGWVGAIVFFDENGQELARGMVSLPADMGSSSDTMQYIDVDTTKIAYWQCYSTDTTDGSGEITVLDDNSNTDDNSSSDNASDTSDADNMVSNADENAADNSNAAE